MAAPCVVGLFFLDRCLLRQHGVEIFGRELGAAVVGIKTVDLLLHVGQLRVAKTAHIGMEQNCLGKSLEAVKELLLIRRCCTVAPAGIHRACPARAAVLADKRAVAPESVLFISVAIDNVDVHVDVLPLLQGRQMLGKHLGILLVIGQTELSLCSDPYGDQLLPPGKVLMEIKCSGGMPLWMVHVLTEQRIFKTSFSKYGTGYATLIYPKLKQIQATNDTKEINTYV